MDTNLARGTIFRHLDGVVIVPIILSLYHKKFFSYLEEKQIVSLNECSAYFTANKGYLNVALRALASQGYLTYIPKNTENDISISFNEHTAELIQLIDWYLLVDDLRSSYDVHSFLGKEADKHHAYFQIVDRYIQKRNELGTIQDNRILYKVLKQIEGYLVAPVIVNLGMSGMFHKYFMETSFRADEYHKQPEVFAKILNFLTYLNWFSKKNENYQFTEEGLFFAKRASSYGVTVSYLPLLLTMDDLLFGVASNLRNIEDRSPEIHVDRAMNVWGSGGAHATYFKVIDDFIIDIFNKPLDQQPKGILDMGCGNGALLMHLYNTIERYTLRGKHLNEHPLFLVGVDYNETALKITRANLIANDIWAKVIWGDIGNPDLLANDLKQNYTIDLKDLLNMRTFLDHNRIWEVPKDLNVTSSTSTGAFAFRGEWLPNELVEASLKEHLNKWKPYLAKNGLLLIELHTVSADITAKNIGKTPATAYDATHGFSDQYILELGVFHKIIDEIGLKVDDKLFKKYPNTEYATVSINYLK